MIKRAMDLVFYASPWSPPPFMKGKKVMLQGVNYYLSIINHGLPITPNSSKPMKPKESQFGE